MSRPRLLTWRVSADEFSCKFGLLSCKNDESTLKENSEKTLQIKNSRTKIGRKKSTCSDVPTNRNPEHQRIYKAIFCDQSDSETSEHSDDVDMSLFHKDRLKSINLTNKSKLNVIVMSDTATHLKSRKFRIKDNRNGKSYKCL